MTTPETDAIVMPRSRDETAKIERLPGQSIAADEQTIRVRGQEREPTCAELIRLVSSAYYLEREKRG